MGPNPGVQLYTGYTGFAGVPLKPRTQFLDVSTPNDI